MPSVQPSMTWSSAKLTGSPPSRSCRTFSAPWSSPCSSRSLRRSPSGGAAGAGVEHAVRETARGLFGGLLGGAAFTSSGTAGGFGASMISTSSTSKVKAPAGAPGGADCHRRRGCGIQKRRFSPSTISFRPSVHPGDHRFDSEGRGLAARDRAVEHLSVGGPAAVVHYRRDPSRGVLGAGACGEDLRGEPSLRLSARWRAAQRRLLRGYSGRRCGHCRCCARRGRSGGRRLDGRRRVRRRAFRARLTCRRGERGKSAKGLLAAWAHPFRPRWSDAETCRLFLLVCSRLSLGLPLNAALLSGYSRSHVTARRRDHLSVRECFGEGGSAETRHDPLCAGCGDDW